MTNLNEQELVKVVNNQANAIRNLENNIRKLDYELSRMKEDLRQSSNKNKALSVRVEKLEAILSRRLR